ncbi:MAG: glycosyltransferase [Nitrospirales bacterium]|nr:glycosyltransferase [Nitrospirales bacterium]
MPKVSVIMPVFNGEQYLREAVETILSQTFRDLELIIIDDGSTDSSAQIISECEAHDPRIMPITNASNEGIISSLNNAIKKAGGKYIARMDCDDRSLPERLERQVSFLDEHMSVGLLGTGAHIIDEGGMRQGLVLWPASDVDLRRALIRLCPFFHPSVMIRSEVFPAVGFYDPRFRHAEDYELWLRISRSFEIANIEEPLIEYRVLREGSVGAIHHRESKLSVARAQWSSILEGLYSPLYSYCVVKSLFMAAMPSQILDMAARMYHKRIMVSS